MEMLSVQSSQIAEIGHDGYCRLRIRFRRGGLYEYSAVSAVEFDALKAAESIGSHFSRFIKGTKPFRKVEDAENAPSAPTIETPNIPPGKTAAPLPVEALAVSQKSTELSTRAQTVQVVNEESQVQASSLLLTVTAIRKEIADTFKPMKDAAHRAHRTICEQEKTLDLPLAEAEKALKDRIGAYVFDQQRLARQVEEELRRAELERARLASEKEAIEQALSDAVSLEAQGNIEAAEAILADPAPVPLRYAAPASVAPRMASVAGVTTRTDWDFRVINEALIPREYVLLNESAIRNVGKATKGKARIPGIEFFSKPLVAASRSVKNHNNVGFRTSHSQ